MQFYKYHGAGNDFIIIDDRALTFPANNYGYIRQLCRRRFGIGADGLMLLQNHTRYAFNMLYYNADGHPGSMCGNGGRCIVAFAQLLRLFNTQVTFLAPDGPHHATAAENGIIHLHMADVAGITQLPAACELNTGSPHYVQEVNNLEEYPVVARGKEIRYHEPYVSRGGINVNFYQRTPAGISIRTYERGVEDETLACGTGATAAALAWAHTYQPAQGDGDLAIQAMGGTLGLRWQRRNDSYTNIWLSGPARHVFTGTLPPPQAFT